MNSPNILSFLPMPGHIALALSPCIPFVPRVIVTPFSSSFCKATILSSVTIIESIQLIDFCQLVSYSLVRASARDGKVHWLEVDPRLKAQLKQHLQKQGYELESLLPSLGLAKRQSGWLKSSD